MTMEKIKDFITSTRKTISDVDALRKALYREAPHAYAPCISYWELPSSLLSAYLDVVEASVAVLDEADPRGYGDLTEKQRALLDRLEQLAKHQRPLGSAPGPGKYKEVDRESP